MHNKVSVCMDGDMNLFFETRTNVTEHVLRAVVAMLKSTKDGALSFQTDNEHFYRLRLTEFLCDGGEEPRLDAWQGVWNEKD